MSDFTCVIDLENLKTGYGKKVVVPDLTLRVDPGRIVTLIGPNGSGKSTVLKAITRQIAVMGGKITLCDIPMERMPEREISRHVSMVMTGKPKGELLTCREMAAMGRYPYTGRFGILSEKDREKVEEALSLVSAREVADLPFDAVSDGQKQRIMLARAICQEPDIIVLDEPTSYLDMRFKLEILKLLRRLAREKEIGVLMSLHELDLARVVSDVVVCMKDGEAVKSGTVEEVYSGTFLQELFGVAPEEFDPSTGQMRLI